ncbi:hypothetical protein CSUI_009800 [Cystoisospora suis]|uniref:Uncharacterized protein n=1 Tax=Cystoisospora suis TaxID=483139 RepID=A0A2C6KIS0_9APIC|nr:hypothetical protein CSUI_009800 [Cystoisospora suis]
MFASSSSNFLTSSHSSSSPPIPPVVAISGHPTLCTYTPFWHRHFSSPSFLGASLAPTVLCKSPAPRPTSLVSSFLLERYRHEEKHAIGSSASSVYTPRDRSCSELGRQAEKYGGEGRSAKSLLEREIVNGVGVFYLPDLFEGERISVMNDQREGTMRRERETRRGRRMGGRKEDDLDEIEDEDEDFFCTCRREEEEEDEGGGDEETEGDSEEEEEEKRRTRRRGRDTREFLLSSSYEGREKHPFEEKEEEEECSSLSFSSSSSSSSVLSDQDESLFSSTLLEEDQRDDYLDETNSPPSSLLSPSSSSPPPSCTAPSHPDVSSCQRQDLDSFSSSSSPRSPSRHRQERGCEVYVQRLPVNHRRVSVPVLVSPVGPKHDALQFQALRYRVNSEEKKQEREETSHDEALLPSRSKKNLSHLSIHSDSSPFSTVECRVQPERIFEFRPRAFWSSDEEEEEEEKEGDGSCRFSFSSFSSIRESDGMAKEDDEEKEEEDEDRNEERSFVLERERRHEWGDGSSEREQSHHISSHHRDLPLSPSPTSSSSHRFMNRSLTRNCRHFRFASSSSFSSSSSSFLSDEAPRSSSSFPSSAVLSDNKKKTKKKKMKKKQNENVDSYVLNFDS